MSENRSPVFLVEDDQDLAATLQRALEAHGFLVERFDRFRQFENRLAQLRPLICVVDANLPDHKGVEIVMRHLSEVAVPTIMISGVYTELPDRILGLELGADDFMLKPFSPRELVARIKAVVRRSAQRSDDSSGTIRFAGWAFRIESLILVAPDREEILLSASEARLLRSLIANAQRVISRDQLLDYICPLDHAAFDRSIDVKISRLRAKLRDQSRNPKIIKTVYGEEIGRAHV